MKHIILISLVVVLSISKAHGENSYVSDSLRVGLVLSGGGAKGAAHIGAIKLLEELGIQVDCIVGTSMGAVIGGMHSIGYSAEQLDTIITNADWNILMSDKVKRNYMIYRDKELDNKTLIEVAIKKEKGKALRSRLPAGAITGENIYNLFSMYMVGYEKHMKFKNLPTPFACVATDIVTGEYVVLEEGLLPLAIRSSMSIPEVFAPVKLQNKLLVDGGVVNNFPVNVALEKGVDFIIGVDVQSPLSTKEDLTSITSVMGQLIGLLGNDLYLENVKKTDILITPYVSDYSTFSFNKKDITKIIELGYNAALEKKDELLALKARLLTLKQQKKDKPHNLFEKGVFINEIEHLGISEEEFQWVLKHSKLHKNMFIDGEILNTAISKLYGTGAFSYVTFSILDSLDKQILRLNFKKNVTNNYGFGLRYDTEEAISLFLSMRFNQPNIYGSRYNVSGALSINPYANVGYSFAPRKFAQFNANYKFSYTDMNIYKREKTVDNLTFIYNGVDLSLSTNSSRNFRVAGGIKLEDFKLTNVEELNVIEDKFVTLDTRSVLSSFLKVDIDNRDDAYYPTQGVLSKNNFSYYITSLKKNIKPFTAFSFSVSGAISLNDTFVVEPSFYGRVVWGDEIPVVFANYMGGERTNRYLSQQMSFIGINNADLFENSLFVVGLSLRQRIQRKSYVYLTGDYSLNSHFLSDIFRGNNIWGVGLKYSYNSKFGPLSITGHWSDYRKKFGVYINLGYYF